MPHSISILGAGWLGLPLGVELAAQGHTVYASTTSPEKLPALTAAGLHPFHLDLGAESLSPEHPFWKSGTLIITVPPSSAAKGARKSTHAPSPLYRDRVARALDLSLKNGLQRVFYTSSTSVYGELSGAVDEDIPAAPRSTSAQMVRQVEELLLERLGEKATILRLGGLVGEDREPTRYLTGKEGLKNGDALVNMVHREDVIRAICLLTQSSPQHSIYNIVADLHPSRQAYHIARAIHLGISPPTFSPSQTSSKTVLNHRLKNEFGFEFLHPDPVHFP